MRLAAVGVYEPTTPIQDLDTHTFREVMRVTVESNYCECPPRAA